MKCVFTNRQFLVFWLVCVHLLCFDTLKAQDCPPNGVQLILPDTLRFETGENFCVPIRITNFEDIVIFVFAVNFDSRVLRYQNANTTISGLPSFTPSDVIGPFPPNNRDIIRVLWSSPNVVGETLADSTILLELCFSVIGTPGSESPICINSNGLNSPVDFINEASQPLPVCAPTTCPVIEPIPPFSAEPQGFISSQCGSGGLPNSGVVEMRIFYGTPPYTITDELGNSTTMAANAVRFIQTGLSQGPHTFTITDANGLMSTPVDFIIDNTPPFSVTSSLRLPRCPTENNGRITLSVAGGRPFSNNSYFFNWGPDALGRDLLERTSLQNGIYNVIIEDSLGCRQTEQINMLRTEVELTNIIPLDALCDGRNNGRIQVSATGGGPYSNGGYDFFISGVTNVGNIVAQTANNRPTATFSMLPPGKYVISALDSVGRGNCPSMHSDSIEIGFSTNYSAQIISGIPNNCGVGTESAQFTIAASTTNPPFEVIIQNSAGMDVSTSMASGNTFTTECLPSGTYAMQLTDAQGCAFDTSFVLRGCDLVVDSILTTPFCAGDSSGAILLIATSSSMPIRFLWNTGDTTSELIGLASGTYSVTISDADTCEIQLSFVIPDPPTFTINFSERAIECPGDIGNVIAIPNGGIAPYEYEWDPDPTFTTDAVLSDVVAGTYNVTVTDDNGCSVESSYRLADPIPPQVNVTNVGAPLCLGENSGRALINAIPNADYPGPFAYLSSTGARSDFANFGVTNFPSGRNWIIVATQACVFDTIFVDIPVANSLRIDTALSTISTIECFGGAGLQGATANLRALGGTNINFQWPDGDVTNVKLGLSAGTYVITLTSPNCSAIDSITIDQPDSISILLDSLNSTFPACGGASTADLSLLVSGGTTVGNMYTISWTDSSNTVVGMGNVLSGVNVGRYTAMVRDDNNCVDELQVIVPDAPLVFGVLGEITQPLCIGDQGVIRIDSAYGGEGNYRYQVNTLPALPISAPFNVIPGMYTIRIFDLVGCSWDTTVTIISPSPLEVNAGADTEVELGTAATLVASITNTNPVESINWDPVGGFNCLTANCSSIAALPIRDQLYTVTVTDVNGCIAEDDVLVSVVQSRNVYTPNVFAPRSADPNNRFFRVYTGTGVETIDFLRIYDRWGNLVHEELNLFPSPQGTGVWNGEMNNQELPSGVYVYVVQVRYLGEEIPEVRKGDITLLR